MSSTVVASQRYSTSIAPVTLRLTQELANTIAHPRPPVGEDLIGELEAAQTWLNTQLADWSARNGVARHAIQLTPASLRQLRQFRDTIRALLTGEQQSPPAAITASLEAAITADGSRLAPAGKGISLIKGAIAIELHLADARDDLRRLKICRNARCGIAFYDQSKNNSRTWHNVAKCGNVANVRAYRERQRTAPAS